MFQTAYYFDLLSMVRSSALMETNGTHAQGIIKGTCTLYESHAEKYSESFACIAVPRFHARMKGLTIRFKPAARGGDTAA